MKLFLPTKRLEKESTMSLRNTQIPPRCEFLVEGWIREEIESVTPVELNNMVKQYHPLTIVANNTVVKKLQGEQENVVYTVSPPAINSECYSWPIRIQFNGNIEARKHIKIGIIELSKSTNLCELPQEQNFCGYQWRNGAHVEVKLDCKNKLLNLMTG